MNSSKRFESSGKPILIQRSSRFCLSHMMGTVQEIWITSPGTFSSLPTTSIDMMYYLTEKTKRQTEDYARSFMEDKLPPITAESTTG